MHLVYSISTNVQDLKNKTIYTVALSMFNINLRSRSAELNYTPLLTLSRLSISPRSISDVLKYYTVALSMFNINLRSKSAEQIYTPLLTLSIFILSLRLGSDVLKFYHGCSQYVQYQPTFKIWGTKLYTSAYPQDIQYQPTFKIWRTKLFTRFLSVCSISTYVQDLRNLSIHLCLP